MLWEGVAEETAQACRAHVPPVGPDVPKSIQAAGLKFVALESQCFCC